MTQQRANILFCLVYVPGPVLTFLHYLYNLVLGIFILSLMGEWTLELPPSLELQHW